MLLIYQCTAQQNVESQLLYLNYFSEVPTYVIRAIPFGQLPNPNHQLWLHREGRRQPTQPQPTQRTWHIPSWPYTTWHHSVSCRGIVVFLCNLWLCLAPEGFFFLTICNLCWTDCRKTKHHMFKRWDVRITRWDRCHLNGIDWVICGYVYIRKKIDNFLTDLAALGRFCLFVLWEHIEL